MLTWNRTSAMFKGWVIGLMVCLLVLALVAPVAVAAKGGKGGGTDTGGGKGGGGKGGKGDGGGTVTTTTVVSGTVSGEAYGAWAQVDLLALLGLKTTVEIAKTPYVALTTDTHAAESQTTLSVILSNILNSATLESAVIGGVGPEKGGVVSYSVVEDLNILEGLITADAVLAMCDSAFDENGARIDMSGSLLANLQVGGIAITAVPAPNTVINLDLAQVILNEQVITGPGEGTVNLIHVKLLRDRDNLLGALLGSIVGGDIIISSATCQQNLTLTEVNDDGDPDGEVNIDDGFVTGGGRLGDQHGFATFGFNAGKRGGKSSIHLQYNDHLNGYKLHVNSEGPVTIMDNCALFDAVGDLNGSPVDVSVETCDNGEPGKDGIDSFVVSWPGYSSDSFVGWMTQGNIQLHSK
ncbi:choice-of-anchor P family protein [Neptuniibacter sp. CAU 1671]|uniref:choice-of-anchor P family protein n=1 Tax=Neptuniibacter sp. CAU 1671 TaxID=3032593 RepID=UPI0023DB3B22|nr:choice-of-anchor P family protein [Neptuniibacter sp. CAU 1671]MDF2180930.1 choice-of-anchor P family protein [Neptuniibacter sp. CAU 1671]